MVLWKEPVGCGGLDGAHEGVAMGTVSDDDLILMYREGDAEAFDALFDRYHTAVYNFARAMLGRAGGGEEVLQETFLAVARTARTYTPRGRFRAWLMRIVRNRCLNRLQSERLRRAALTESGLSVGEVASHDPPPPRAAERGPHDRACRHRRVARPPA